MSRPVGFKQLQGAASTRTHRPLAPVVRSRPLPSLRPHQICARTRLNTSVNASADSRLLLQSNDEREGGEVSPLATVIAGVSAMQRMLLGFLSMIAHNLEVALLKCVPLFMGIWIVYVKKAFQAAITRAEHVKPVGTSKAFADLSPFLFPLEINDVKTIRKMSAMSALSYRPKKLNPASLKRRMNMEFLNSSYAVKAAASAEALANTPIPEKGPFAMAKEIWSSATKSLSDSDDYLDFTFLEWFSADEPSTNTRYFVVMGSDTVDHWRLNLTLDPVPFEDPDLGVKIHSGVYEAAENLYAKFLPSVVEFLKKDPKGKICFLGHSIGGSMAVALMLMFKMRGVIRLENIADVYTFGMPSVFLEGEDCFNRVVSAKSSWEGYEESGALHDKSMTCKFGTHCELCSSGPRGLLEAVGLPETSVRNVISAFDFVPRAFTSDYNGVAELIRTMGPGLQSHSMLSREGRKHLYFFVGKVIVMQCDSELTFVGEEGPHPMLPAEPNIYAVESPNAALKYRPPHLPIPGGPPPPNLGSFVPSSAAEAVSELMDNPHPMEMFNRPMWTYGGDGLISRYHNPENYTRAFGRAIHLMQQRAPSKTATISRLLAPVR